MLYYHREVFFDGAQDSPFSVGERVVGDEIADLGAIFGVRKPVQGDRCCHWGRAGSKPVKDPEDRHF